MGGFDEIKLGWQGKTYAIPANSAMRAIALIEEHITMQELVQYAQRGTAPIGRLANAYASILRFAGCKVEDFEVYLGMFGNDGGQEAIAASVNGLLTMMIPSDLRKRMEQGLAPKKPVLLKGEKEPDLGNSRETAKATSKPTTRSRSGKAGAHQKTSGNSHLLNSTG